MLSSSKISILSLVIILCTIFIILIFKRSNKNSETINDAKCQEVAQKIDLILPIETSTINNSNMNVSPLSLRTANKIQIETKSDHKQKIEIDEHSSQPNALTIIIDCCKALKHLTRQLKIFSKISIPPGWKIVF